MKKKCLMCVNHYLICYWLSENWSEHIWWHCVFFIVYLRIWHSLIWLHLWKISKKSYTTKISRISSRFGRVSRMIHFKWAADSQVHLFISEIPINKVNCAITYKTYVYLSLAETCYDEKQLWGLVGRLSAYFAWDPVT